jgi:uncharacterized membrane protein YagU involved in acid resistance
MPPYETRSETAAIIFFIRNIFVGCRPMPANAFEHLVRKRGGNRRMKTSNKFSSLLNLFTSMTTLQRASTLPSSIFHSLPVPKAFPIIVWGGLLAGTLDATDGVVAYGTILGLNPIQVLQFIASGAFGAASFKGGLVTAGAGVLFHFFIAFAVATAFYVAARLVPLLAKQYVPSGLIYGLGVFLFMNYVVLPFTQVAPAPFSWPLFLNGVIGHAVFVGLPISWFAHRSAQAQVAYQD